MGYNTRYSLKTEFLVGGKAVQLVDDSPLVAVIEDLRQRYEDAMFALSPTGDTEDSCKWYEHQAQMKSFSILHPNVLFTLHGEGEENDDLWNEYYLNGKVQVEKATIQIAPFDAKKLK